MAESGGYGERFGARLKIGTPVFFTHKVRSSLIAVTEVRSDNPARRLSPPQRAEDALQIALQLRDFPRHGTWLDGKAQPVTALRGGDTHRPCTRVAAVLADAPGQHCAGLWFRQPNPFTRAFARRIGTSPGAWRRQQRIEDT